MDYYDYRSYFNSIIDDLEILQSGQSNLQTSITDIKTTITEKLDTINNTIQSGISIILCILVLSTAIKVIFK